jgi:hypothetical protein
MAHHYKFGINGPMRTRLLQYLCRRPYARCACIQETGGIDWSDYVDAEVIADAHVTVDVTDDDPEKAEAVAHRIGESLCTESYQLEPLDRDASGAPASVAREEG